MDLDFIDTEARARYRDRRQQDLRRYRESLTAKDFSVLETVGHNLKGNGSSFGFPELSRLGEQMEVAAKSSDFSQCKSCLEQFSNWLSTQI